MSANMLRGIWNHLLRNADVRLSRGVTAWTRKKHVEYRGFSFYAHVARNAPARTEAGMHRAGDMWHNGKKHCDITAAPGGAVGEAE